MSALAIFEATGKIFRFNTKIQISNGFKKLTNFPGALLVLGSILRLSLYK